MNNPCKECIIKSMCNDPCDNLIISLIRVTDSKLINIDLLDFCKWKASILRNELQDFTNAL